MNCNGPDLGALPRRNDPDMIARLARVIDWAGCVLASIWLAFWLHAIGTTPYHDPGLALGVTLGGAAVIWMTGRAVRYVMIGGSCGPARLFDRLRRLANVQN